MSNLYPLRNEEDTIVAVATPPGRGGVGIIRISGSKAYSIAAQISSRDKISPRQSYYTAFYHSDMSLIDKGLLLYFKAPNSFTGEDIVEFQVHGAPIVLELLIQECLTYGARIARPGEFSERAFLNQKIDLIQAEAIADLINASSNTAARMAVRSLQGEFSQKICSLNEKLINLRMHVEAAIDFPEEEIDFLANGKIISMLDELVDALGIIKDSATQGAIIRDGLNIVIAGFPNAGKSTLINALAQREVAIVTSIAGTTRDVMREYIFLDDIPVYIIDTAGLRESDDLIEQEGIKRAWQEMRKADCVLFLMDVTKQEPNFVLPELNDNIPCIAVMNISRR